MRVYVTIEFPVTVKDQDEADALAAHLSPQGWLELNLKRNEEAFDLEVSEAQEYEEG
jgi:hypothetical protein